LKDRAVTVVAIACENVDYDGAIFAHLLTRLWQHPVERWQTEHHFTGRNAVLKYLGAFLHLAADDGVHFALVAIDNDGGARRQPEHDPLHRTEEEANRPRGEGCSVCSVEAVIPPAWCAPPRHRCVVVPVQTLETWLLYLRGDTMSPTPEQVYQRTKLKKMFFGPTLPPVADHRAQALAVLQAPDALDRLRALRSFRHFAEQVTTWPPKGL